MFRRVLIVAVFALAVAGCGGGSTAAPAAKTEAQAPAPTVAPAAKAAAPTVAPPTVAPTVAPTKAPPTAVPTKAPTAAPTDTPVAKVGEAVEANGVKLTVNGVERKTEINQFLKAKEGRAFLLADVTIENVGQPEHDYNPFWFKVRDASGQEYNITISGQDSLSSGKLGKGEKVKGIVAFDVKADAKDPILIYSTTPMTSSRAQQIRVSLGNQ